MSSNRPLQSSAKSSFYLRPRLVPDWPKLAWVATFAEGSCEIRVLHGPRVEVTDDWVVEAVWAGEYESGDFDRTDLVFGTGVRNRGKRVAFVSAGTAMDRLWYCNRESRWYVSNSLGALNACAGLSLLEDHLYVNDRLSDFRTTWGLEKCVRSCPAHPVDVKLIWFNNLVYDGDKLHEVIKPDSAPHFQVFGDYFSFLVETAQALKKNIEAPGRSHEVKPLATVSSGYDSTAAAVIARHAGCKSAITIRQSSSFWRGSDSGEHIAGQLGMECKYSQRTARSFPHEAAFWAGSGWSNLINWTLFPYPTSVCLIFQGNYGDSIWDRKPLPRPFVIEIWDDLALGEFRLIKGLLQCPVPFWGMRHAGEINRITFSEEMRSWTLNRKYDRPIPRRLVEEAGIPRGDFGVLKKDTSHESGFRWPYSVDSQKRFKTFLQARGFYAPGRTSISMLRGLARVESLVTQNIFRRLGIRKRYRPWKKLSGTRLLFHWANHELKKKYEEDLKDI